MRAVEAVVLVVVLKLLNVVEVVPVIARCRKFNMLYKSSLSALSFALSLSKNAGPMRLFISLFKNPTTMSCKIPQLLLL